MVRPDLRANILAAAVRLFARYGFNKTSVDELARAAHVSKATLYQYFAGKQEIFAETVRTEGARMFDHMDAAIAAAPTHAAKLRAFFTSFLEALVGSVVIQEATSEAIIELLPLAHEVTRDFEGEGRCRLVELVQGGIDAGEFTVTDATHAGAGLDLAAHGLHMAFIDRSDLERIRNGLPALLDLLLRGLTAPQNGGC